MPHRHARDRCSPGVASLRARATAASQPCGIQFADAPAHLTVRAPTAETTARQLRGSSLLAGGRVLSVGLALLVQVLIVRYLTQHEYGAFAFALAVVSLASSVGVLGLDKTLARFLPLYEEEKREELIIGALLLTAIVLVVLGLIVVVPIIAAHDWLNETLIHDDQATELLTTLLLMAPLQAFDAVLVATFAVFGSARSIFFRRYVVAPLLQLIAVLLVVFLDLGVGALAIGYLLSTLIGVLAYITLLVRLLDDRGLFAIARARGTRIPARELLAFTLPLMSTDLVFVLRGSLVVIFLQALHGAAAVASYRAVLPVARQNMLVQQNFSYLFVPFASRLFARRQLKELNDIYWQTAVWITLLSFPVFILSFSLAMPVTVLLFGERYTDAAIVLSWLALGYYLNSAMGFNGLTLRVFGRVGYIVAVDLISALLSVVLTILLIAELGAVGGAIGVSVTLVLQNLLYQAGLTYLTGIEFLPRRFMPIYALLGTSAILLLLFQQTVGPPAPVAFAVGLTAIIVLLVVGQRSIDLSATFPEVARLPIVRWLIR